LFGVGGMVFEDVGAAEEVLWEGFEGETLVLIGR
jgi:hypothetical protein